MGCRTGSASLPGGENPARARRSFPSIAAFDPADAEPDPDFEFDQSLPPGFDD
jgi:hypothetical protein